MSAQGAANASSASVYATLGRSVVLAENPEGVALNGGWVDWSMPNVSLVNRNSKSSTNLTEYFLEDRGIVRIQFGANVRVS